MVSEEYAGSSFCHNSNLATDGLHSDFGSQLQRRVPRRPRQASFGPGKLRSVSACHSPHLGHGSNSASATAFGLFQATCIGFSESAPPLGFSVPPRPQRRLPASASGDLSSVSASGGSIPALFGPHDTSRTLYASAFGEESRGLLSPPFLSPSTLCMEVTLAVVGCWEEEGDVGGSNTEEKPSGQEGAGLLPASKLETGLHSTTGFASDISPFELWLLPSAPESAMVSTSICEQGKPEEANSEMGFPHLCWFCTSVSDFFHG